MRVKSGWIGAGILVVFATAMMWGVVSAAEPTSAAPAASDAAAPEAPSAEKAAPAPAAAPAPTQAPAPLVQQPVPAALSVAPAAAPSPAPAAAPAAALAPAAVVAPTPAPAPAPTAAPVVAPAPAPAPAPAATPPVDGAIKLSPAPAAGPAEAPQKAPRISQNYLRLLVFLGGSAPVSGEKTGLIFGGVLGYDFKDTYGLELLLSQSWLKVNLDDAPGTTKMRGLKVLELKPGFRYRFYGDTLRASVFTHIGLAQIDWNRYGQKSRYAKKSMGFDLGLSGQYIVSDIFLVELFAMYNIVQSNVPARDNRHTHMMHGLLFGVGVGFTNEGKAAVKK